MLECGIGLESFYTPEFVYGEEGKTSAVTFHQSLEMWFLKNLCWHLWFLISLKSEEVIFSDDTATEVSANEFGYVGFEEFQKAAARSGYSVAPQQIKYPMVVFSIVCWKEKCFSYSLTLMRSELTLRKTLSHVLLGVSPLAGGINCISALVLVIEDLTKWEQVCPMATKLLLLWPFCKPCMNSVTLKTSLLVGIDNGI